MKIHNDRPCVCEEAQHVRLGSPGRKNGAASSRRVQNSTGIPGVSSPMGNNEDSASFITTCSSIPDLTSRAPTSGWLTLGSPPAVRARERDASQRPLSLSNRPVATRVRHPQPPSAPYFQPVLRPTPAAYPGNARGSVIANRETGLDIVRKVTVYGSCACALAHV